MICVAVRRKRISSLREIGPGTSPSINQVRVGGKAIISRPPVSLFLGAEQEGRERSRVLGVRFTRSEALDGDSQNAECQTLLSPKRGQARVTRDASQRRLMPLGGDEGNLP